MNKDNLLTSAKRVSIKAKEKGNDLKKKLEGGYSPLNKTQGNLDETINDISL